MSLGEEEMGRYMEKGREGERESEGLGAVP